MNMRHWDCSFSLSISFNLSTDQMWHLIIVSISTTPSSDSFTLCSNWIFLSFSWPLQLQTFTLLCPFQPQMVYFLKPKGIMCQLSNFLSLSFSSKTKSLPILRFWWQTVDSPRTAPPSGHRQEPRTPPVLSERMVSLTGRASLVLHTPPLLPPTPKRTALTETCPQAMKLLQVGTWDLRTRSRTHPDGLHAR